MDTRVFCVCVCLSLSLSHTHTHTHILLCTRADMMPKLRADKGAIKFVLSGANIMCPGLTSKGATMHDEVRGGKR
jgi:predicted RNA-binding protein (TIGR00451 family)